MNENEIERICAKFREVLTAEFAEKTQTIVDKAYDLCVNEITNTGALVGLKPFLREKDITLSYKDRIALKERLSQNFERLGTSALSVWRNSQSGVTKVQEKENALETPTMSETPRRKIKKGSRRRWSDDDDNMLMRAVAENKSTGFICKKLGRTEKAVWARMNKLGVAVNKNKTPKIIKELESAPESTPQSSEKDFSFFGI